MLIVWYFPVHYTFCNCCVHSQVANTVKLITCLVLVLIRMSSLTLSSWLNIAWLFCSGPTVLHFLIDHNSPAWWLLCCRPRLRLFVSRSHTAFGQALTVLRSSFWAWWSSMADPSDFYLFSIWVSVITLKDEFYYMCMSTITGTTGLQKTTTISAHLSRTITQYSWIHSILYLFIMVCCVTVRYLFVKF